MDNGFMGIISDNDPLVLEKLLFRWKYCREQREYMKAVNKYYRERGTCHGYPDMPDATASMLDNQMGGRSLQKAPYSYGIMGINRQEILNLEWRIRGILRKQKGAMYGSKNQ